MGAPLFSGNFSSELNGSPDFSAIIPKYFVVWGEIAPGVTPLRWASPSAGRFVRGAGIGGGGRCRCAIGGTAERRDTRKRSFRDFQVIADKDGLLAIDSAGHAVAIAVVGEGGNRRTALFHCGEAVFGVVGEIERLIGIKA